MKVLIDLGVLLIFVALSGCQSSTVDNQGFARVMAEGEEIYQLNCQRCHHPQGQGYRHLFPNLSANQIVTLRDPVPIIQIVKHGRGAMPSFNEALTDAEIAAVLTYIRNAWGNEAAPVNPEQVRN